MWAYKYWSPNGPLIPSIGSFSFCGLAGSCTYALTGNKVAAEKLLDQILAVSRRQYVFPYYPALVYAGLGRNDEALDCLEKGFEDHSNGIFP
jgi:tetratricopeptide (TPR) repeat protein